MKNESEYKGYNGTIILDDKTLIIKRGIKGFLLGGGMLRGDKTIPYSRIVAVQLKKAGLTAGYIQFTLMGGSEAKGGLFQSTRDENSINFHNRGDNNERFTELKKIIEQKIANDGSDTSNNFLNDIEKLSELKNKGIITEEEFEKKKKQLLGI